MSWEILRNILKIFLGPFLISYFGSFLVPFYGKRSLKLIFLRHLIANNPAFNFPTKFCYDCVIMLGLLSNFLQILSGRIFCGFIGNCNKIFWKILPFYFWNSLKSALKNYWSYFMWKSLKNVLENLFKISYKRAEIN